MAKLQRLCEAIHVHKSAVFVVYLLDGNKGWTTSTNNHLILHVQNTKSTDKSGNSYLLMYKIFVESTSLSSGVEPTHHRYCFAVLVYTHIVPPVFVIYNVK